MRTPRFFAFTALLSLLGVASTGLAGCGGGSSPTVTTPVAPAAAKNIYAIEYGNGTTESIAAFSTSATGTASPASTLTLPNNFIPTTEAIGPQGQIYVAGYAGTSRPYGTVLEYAAGSSGSATPAVTLNGSAAGTATFTDVYSIAVNSANTLFVSSEDGTLEAFASGFTASSSPTQYLTWGKTNFLGTGDQIVVDNAGEIFYVDYGSGRGVKSVIDVFAAGATGATAPVRVITGTNTTSFYYDGLAEAAVDGVGDLFLAYYNEADDPNVTGTISTLANNEATGIIEFAAGATGNATPVKRISGSATKIVEPDGLAIDSVGNLYYADTNDGYFSQGNAAELFEIFSSSATGNAAPTASITTTGYTYNDGDDEVVVY